MSSAFEEDSPGAVRKRAESLAALRRRREEIITLFAFRRPNGLPLSDVAIALRVGCRPSEVTRIRAEEAGA